MKSTLAESSKYAKRCACSISEEGAQQRAHGSCCYAGVAWVHKEVSSVVTRQQHKQRFSSRLLVTGASALSLPRLETRSKEFNTCARLIALNAKDHIFDSRSQSNRYVPPQFISNCAPYRPSAKRGRSTGIETRKVVIYAVTG